MKSAPALELPDPRKAFQFHVHERQEVILGVLIQLLGSVVCIPIQKTGMASMFAATATCDLLYEAEKYSSGQSIIVHIPQKILTLVEGRTD